MNGKLMGRACVFAVIASVGLCAFAERLPLWPAGKMPLAQGHQIAAMTDESGAKGFAPDAHREPYLEWFPAPTNKPVSTCLILVSGGAYNSCCDVNHVKTWRKTFSNLGVQCVNLVYRTPRPKGLPFYATAWADGQRAVRLVRAEAAKRGYSPDRIGAFGMSAGSHLVTLLATSSRTAAYAKVDEADDVPCNLNFACTCALAYALTDGLGCQNAKNGEGDGVALDSVFAFDGGTCPMWLCHGEVDPYSANASRAVHARLKELKIPAELIIYPKMGHAMLGVGHAVNFVRKLGFLDK